VGCFTACTPAFAQKVKDRSHSAHAQELQSPFPGFLQIDVAYLVPGERLRPGAGGAATNNLEQFCGGLAWFLCSETWLQDDQ